MEFHQTSNIVCKEGYRIVYVHQTMQIECTSGNIEQLRKSNFETLD